MTVKTVLAALLAASLTWPLEPLAAPCPEDHPPGLRTSYSTAWGFDVRNTRYQPRSLLNAENAASLRLKWAYGLSHDTPRSYPVVTEDTIFIGDSGKGVVALDRRSGCERWTAPHEGYFASAMLLAESGQQRMLIYTDRESGIYAIDAENGRRLWHTVVTEEPIPWYSGTPLVAGERLFVPISSQEVALAFNPLYGCCTTSGGMAALELATGERLWYRPTIQTDAKQTGRHWLLVSKYGPSGAPVWGAPSFDAAHNRLYFGTGQNYSHPTTETSNALFALDAESGEPIWSRQFTPDDAYTAACNLLPIKHPNCPDPPGPDVDFGAPTMLVRSPAGETLLIAGQKSAEVHALRAESGAPVWTTRLGRGGIIGGVHWGMAANEDAGVVFVPISDKAIADFPAPGEPRPGLYALDVATGAVKWSFTRASRCEETACVYGLSAAIAAANDVVVTGSMDGYLAVHHAESGEQLWRYDAWRAFDAVNEVAATGGAFDAHGPYLADNLLIVTSGYGYVGRQRGGNALLVFEVAGER